MYLDDMTRLKISIVMQVHMNIIRVPICVLEEIENHLAKFSHIINYIVFYVRINHLYGIIAAYFIERNQNAA